MNPDDPRHGTHAGYKAGCRDTCCKDAAARYERGREWDQDNGRLRTYPALGFRRRVEALRALGWSVNAIADALDLDVRNLPRMQVGRIYARHHHAMCDLFDRWSMTLPDDTYANRRRSIAARNGYAPPLAWDNIDDPDEQPVTTSHDRTQVDEVAVRRRMNGDRNVRLNRAEKVALVKLWRASDLPGNQCQEVTGINLFRTLREVG